jgi:hypothetical protein
VAAINGGSGGAGDGRECVEHGYTGCTETGRRWDIYGCRGKMPVWVASDDYEEERKTTAVDLCIYNRKTRVFSATAR